MNEQYRLVPVQGLGEVSELLSLEFLVFVCVCK